MVTKPAARARDAWDGSTRRALVESAPSWMDDVDFLDAGDGRPETVLVRGQLHNGDAGMVVLQHTGVGWTQRGRESTAHLNADYVSHEKLNDILASWVPVDFSVAEATSVTCDVTDLSWDALKAL